MTLLRHLSLTILIGLVSASCGDAQVTIVRSFPGLTFANPVDLQHAGDGTDRLFVVEQEGRIRVFPNSQGATSADTSTFLDISDRVAYRGEMGMLGLAFHPDYEENGFFYVYYSTDSPRRQIVARFSVDPANPNRALEGSELNVLTMEDPYDNHNGGQIVFGPDGYLYIGTGDGGAGNDPLNSGQDRESLLGKMLRIDVDRTDGGSNYAIPDDNPFAGNTAGYAGEIWAWGLRNPWRFSFDPANGRLWAADVGQGGWEEVNIIEKGKNYGWRIMEGYHCSPFWSSDCDSTGLTSPVIEYPRNVGTSITGGHVYRGTRAQELAGKYIYGDFGSGRIFALTYDGVNPTVNTQIGQVTLPSSFGVDQSGELYILSYTNNEEVGTIWRFSSSSAVEESEETAAGLRLEQNRPNPVTMTTIFSYTLPSPGRARLALHDMLGREVMVALDQAQPAGSHDVSVDLGRLMPGVYSYSLTAGSRVATRRLVIAR